METAQDGKYEKLDRRSTHITDPPRNRTLLIRRRRLVGLTFDTKIHDMVAADGAVVDYDIPGPESDGVPLYRRYT